MSKRTKLYRRETYWLENNTNRAWDLYQKLNQTRGVDSLTSYEDVADKLQRDTMNNLYNAYEKLDQDKLLAIADRYSKQDLYVETGANFQEIISVKQAAKLVEGAKDIGGIWTINGKTYDFSKLSIDPILKGDISYYDLQLILKPIFNTKENIDMFLFGS